MHTFWSWSWVWSWFAFWVSSWFWSSGCLDVWFVLVSLLVLVWVSLLVLGFVLVGVVFLLIVGVGGNLKLPSRLGFAKNQRGIVFVCFSKSLSRLGPVLMFAGLVFWDY